MIKGTFDKLFFFISIFVKQRMEAQAKGQDVGTCPFVRYKVFLTHHSQYFFHDIFRLAQISLRFQG